MEAVVFGIGLIGIVYLATGCAVAAGSWDSVLDRHAEFPATKFAVVCLAISEAARWPLTLAGK